jgi:hypothetical protein
MPSKQSPRPGREITSRDIEILQGLFECRVMTVAHVATFYFQDRIHAARKRIWKLKAAGFIRERPRPAYEASVLTLTNHALRILLDEGHVENYPRLGIAALQKRAKVSALTLRHELDVMDVRAAFVRAIRVDPEQHLHEFSTWPRMFEFSTYIGNGKRLTVKPDGFVRIRSEQTDHSLFLEVDRSTESLEALRQRIGGYLNFYRQGGYAHRQGYSPTRHKEFPFRVMIVLRTAERRNNLAAKLLARQPPVLTMAVMTTMAELRNDPLSSIWVSPIDYRNALRGSDDPASLFPLNSIYRRRSDREELVEKRITKHALI